MKIQVTVDLGLSPKAKRWTLRLGIPAVVVGLGAVAYAFTPPATWSTGDILQASDLNNAFANLQAQINALQAGLADAGSQVAALQTENAALSAGLSDAGAQLAAASNPNPACPLGYAQGATPAAPTFTNETIIVCTNAATSDQVVKVGTGAAAFWIDRYEASVWTAPSQGAGTIVPDDNNLAYFANDAGVPNNGQTISHLYALSVPGQTPSRMMTWFQAAQFCRASGKRLPNGEEWLAAARGTYDPGALGTSSGGQCNVFAGAIRGTGGALGASKSASCVSDWGAEDMIGNVWEWTSEWYAGLSTATTEGVTGVWPNPANSNYFGDGTWNIASYASTDNAGAWSPDVPAAAFRGGAPGWGTKAGIFAVAMSDAPSGWYSDRGFRCVSPNAR